MLGLGLALFASTAAAANASPLRADSPPESLAVVAIGSCSDPRLGQAARDLRQELARLKPLAVLSEEVTAAPAGGLPRSTPEEIQRAIDSARADFFHQSYPKAEAQLRDALAEISKLPPGPARWALATRARVELSQVYLSSGKRAEASVELFGILRLDQGLKLDRQKYPPALLALADGVRRSVRGATKLALGVKSSGPSTPVFIDGREMGKTPFARALPEGLYEVISGAPSARSFVRSVQLDNSTTLEIDVERESRFQAAAGPCYESGTSTEERLDAASVIAQALSIERVVLVRLDGRGEDQSMSATTFSLGREVREGSHRMSPADAFGLKRLATFVLTGAGPAHNPPRAPRLAEAAVDLRAAASAPPASAAPASRMWARVGAVALGAVAVGLGVAAIAENAHVGSASRDLQGLINRNPTMTAATASNAAALDGEIGSAKKLRTAFTVGAAVAVAGTGTFVVFSIAPGSPARVAQVSLGVAGTLP